MDDTLVTGRRDGEPVPCTRPALRGGCRCPGAHVVEQLRDWTSELLVVAAPRVSTADCARQRIGEPDAALQSSDGHGKAMSIPDLPERMRGGRFPPVYLTDFEALPASLFKLAHENGTLAALAPEKRA